MNGNTESLLEYHAREQLRITDQSLTPTWAGERLDPTTLLQLLVPRDAEPAAA